MSLYRLSNIRHAYRDREVLRVATLTIERGSRVALVGPSGAGKSTLLRLLSLLELPTHGELSICYGEHPISAAKASLADKRRIVSMVQRPVMLTRSIHDNIAYGLRLRGTYSAATVEEWIARLGLQAVARARPQTLSGGEMQRVALARALIIQPDVLLLDEPTANLDPENVRLIEQLLMDDHQQRGTTFVIVTHNLFQMRRLASHVGVLLAGDLISFGASGDVLQAQDNPRAAAFLNGDMVY